MEVEFAVDNFTYDGFGVRGQPGRAPYKAKFVKWTNDPGVAECQCSDGKKRLIPSCQLVGEKSSLPEQKKTGVVFGMPSHSY